MYFQLLSADIRNYLRKFVDATYHPFLVLPSDNEYQRLIVTTTNTEHTLSPTLSIYIPKTITADVCQRFTLPFAIHQTSTNDEYPLIDDYIMAKNAAKAGFHRTLRDQLKRVPFSDYYLESVLKSGNADGIRWVISTYRPVLPRPCIYGNTPAAVIAKMIEMKLPWSDSFCSDAIKNDNAVALNLYIAQKLASTSENKIYLRQAINLAVEKNSHNCVDMLCDNYDAHFVCLQTLMTDYIARRQTCPGHIVDRLTINEKLLMSIGYLPLFKDIYNAQLNVDYVWHHQAITLGSLDVVKFIFEREGHLCDLCIDNMSHLCFTLNGIARDDSISKCLWLARMLNATQIKSIYDTAFTYKNLNLMVQLIKSKLYNPTQEDLENVTLVVQQSELLHHDRMVDFMRCIEKGNEKGNEDESMQSYMEYRYAMLIMVIRKAF